MNDRPIQIAAVFALLLLSVQAYAAAPLSFADDIQPILERSCLPCHNATKAEGGLQLETPKLMEQGGDTGPAIKPNHALESLLFLSASHQKKPFMPPAANKSKAPDMTSMQLEILRRWIDEGALGNPKPKQPVAWKTMPPNVQSVSAVAVTTDGLLAACGRGSDVSIYNVALQRLTASFSAHHDIVGAMTFSPDGTLLATGSYGEIKLWKKVPGAELKFSTGAAVMDRAALANDLKEEANSTVALAVQAGADALIVAGNPDGKINVWNRAPKKLARTISAGAPVKLLAASADGKILAVSAEGKPVQLVTLADGKVIAELKADRDNLNRAAAINLTAAGAAFELTFLQGELKSNQERIGKLSEDLKKADKDLAEFVAKKAVDEKALSDATAKRDALSKPRDEAEDALMTATAAQEAAKAKETETTKALAVAEAALAKADAASKPEAKKAADAVKAAAKAATEAHTAADKVVSAAAEKQKKSKTEFEAAVKAFDEATGALSRGNQADINAKNLAEALNTLRADEKALQAAVASAQKENDAATKAQTDFRQQVEKNLLPPVKAFNFDGGLGVLLTQHSDGSVRAWNGETGEPVIGADITAIWELIKTIGNASSLDTPLSGRVNALAFSPDGKLVASGSGEPSRSGEIKLWDAATGQLVRDIPKPHKDCVLTLDFSSDGKMLASGAADKAVRLWDVSTGKLVRNLEAHANHVLGVCFRHDTRRLVSASSDNSVKTWDLKTSDVLKTFSDFSKEVNSIHYVGQSNMVLATGGAPSVRVMNDAGGDVRAKTDGFAKFVTTGAVSRDGQVQVIGDVTGALRVINSDGKILVQWTGAR